MTLFVRGAQKVDGVAGIGARRISITKYVVIQGVAHVLLLCLRGSMRRHNSSFALTAVA